MVWYPLRMTAITLLTNASIYTMDKQRPTATALAMRDGRIIAIGNDDQIRAIGGNEVNLDGKCVIPGLIDAHVHFRNYALGLQQVDLTGCVSRAEAVERVRGRIATTPPGDWIEGLGWVQDDWTDRAFPSAADLDTLSQQHPIYLKHKSGHAAWVNTVALQMVGIDVHTADPDGGAIQRDSDGRATGILLEAPAMLLVRHHIPRRTDADLAAAMRHAQQLCWSVGLVGLHDFDGANCFRALQLLKREGDLGLRIVKNIPAKLIDHAIALGLQSGFGDDWLRMGGIKIFADGALGPRTALMLDPYESEPNNRGIAVVEKEEMMAIAHKAAGHDLSLTVHAIGDKAVHDVLDVYEAIRPLANPNRPPNRIEHVQHIAPADVGRLAQLGVIASVQPTHATSDMFMVDKWLGADRARWAYAFRDLQAAGARVVFGSDCPIESIDPRKGIHAAVTRRRANGDPGVDGWYPAQRFSLAETIEAFTLAAAITSGQQANTGSITLGKAADLTLFDRDIFALAADELVDVDIAGTIVEGSFRYRTF